VGRLHRGQGGHVLLHRHGRRAWKVIKSNDKKRARVAALRYLLYTLDYADKDRDVVGVPDPLIVGSAAQVYEHGEQPDRFFPKL